MKRTKIVTHYGKAHRDEFLACCVIFFHEYRRGSVCYVERRVVTQTDLASSNVWVVDTGNTYEPEKLNFDHHHLSTEQCSLDMVLRHILGEHVYASYRAVSPWLKNTALQDNNGAKYAAEKLGMELNTYMSTLSPVEKFVLDKFAETMVVNSETYLASMMRDIGRMIVTAAEHMNDDLPAMINNTPSPVEHRGVRLWDIRCLTSDDSTSLAVINQAAYARGVDLLISSTGRAGGGFGLYRQAWAKNKLDLSRIKDPEKIKFAHKNGYYAVTVADLSDDEIMQIIDQAIVSDESDATD